MPKTQIWYNVVVDLPNCEAESLCGLFRSKSEALRELGQQRKHWPNAYLQRVTFARCDERRPKHLQAIWG